MVWLYYWFFTSTLYVWVWYLLSIKLEIYHIAFTTLYTYIFIVFFGRRQSPLVILVITMIHLSYLHLTKEDIADGKWCIEISVIYMMSVCKFSSLVFGYDDGSKKDENIKSQYHKNK